MLSNHKELHNLFRSLNLILIRTRNAEVCVVLIWHLLQEIVQRLFDDQEEESTTNVTEKAPEKPVQDPAVRRQIKLNTYLLSGLIHIVQNLLPPEYIP